LHCLGLVHLQQPVAFADVGVGVGVAMVVIDVAVVVVVSRGRGGSIDGGGALAMLMTQPHTLSHIAVAMVPKPISGGQLQDLLV
jgi:hypothetical protein